MIKFRRTVKEDILKIDSWIQQDPGHRGIVATFFATTEIGVSCYAVESEGQPLIFVREEQRGDVITLHLQFAPHDRKAVVAALREGYPLVAEDARQRGMRRIRFDSESPALIRVMLEMGFRAELIDDL